MRRRTFCLKGLAGASAVTTLGCAGLPGRKRPVERLMGTFTPEMLNVTRPRPKAGSIPRRELGTTGIEVSTFGFGSHMTPAGVPYEKEREFMLREGHDLGINVFDVYDQGIGQYEPTGRHLAPVINDVVISVRGHDCVSDTKLTIEEDIEKTMRLFGRDYIDMVRLFGYSPDSPQWKSWEGLFRLKEKGYVRAVGLPIHFPHDLDQVLGVWPIDFVVFPYNFYHNLNYTGKFGDNYHPIAQKLRDHGIGVVTMKPFASEWFVAHFIEAARELDPTGGEINLPRTMLKWIVQSGLEPDTTIGGMWTTNDVYDDVPAYYDPELTPEEETLIERLRSRTRIIAANTPHHFRHLASWADTTTEMNCPRMT